MSGGRHLMSCERCDEHYYCMCPVDEPDVECIPCSYHLGCFCEDRQVKIINSIDDLRQWISDVTSYEQDLEHIMEITKAAYVMREISPEYGTDWSDFLDGYPILELLTGDLISAVVDEENNCDECWNELMKEFQLANNLDYEGPWPKEWVDKRCVHGASECARCIIVSRG